MTAQWTDLFLATYPVPDELLTPRLPAGLELDRRDGSAYVSLVAFDFRDTRVFGIPWPGFRNFPEVNLRFYVRRGVERGVVFIREIVALHGRMGGPGAVQRTVRRHAIVRAVTETCDALTVAHRLIGRDRTHTIRALGAKPAFRPGSDTVEHFFKEHQWGYGRSRGGVAPIRGPAS